MPMQQPNPYKELPERSFWRPAVADRGLFNLNKLYVKKFALGPKDRIATAGSCFAQHISRALRGNDFHFLDVEPPPPHLWKKHQATLGYGLYSARYGNVYSVRQLVQLFRRADGSFQPSQSFWPGEKGAWFDPFRPTIEPGGFPSEIEARVSRDAHLEAVHRMATQMDVLVFTLGLTEAWVDRECGSVYPVCPGVAAGTFDGDRYVFHNFSFMEIRSDLEELFDLLRAVNPSLRFILTVSPVPLTATASGKHVLEASVLSKSILRAVVGDAEQAHDFVDYFPSYEIVASHPGRAMFFEPNLREVNPRGVSFVMDHFFAEHRPPSKKKKPTKSAPSSEEVICDEAILDAMGGAA